MKQVPVSLPLYSRLTRYLNYLKQLPEDSPVNISAATIAENLSLNGVQVRKDLASVSNGGKPKTGYITLDLVSDIESFLGYDNCCDAVLVGVGNLGRALLSYENFSSYGLKIVAAFDNHPDLVGKYLNGKKIVDTHKLTNLCKRMNIRIGIITVPATCAQAICDDMISGGVRAIWNFAPVNLKAPENVVVKNEDMAASLAILTSNLKESLEKYGLD